MENGQGMTNLQQVFLFTVVVAVTVGVGLEGSRWCGRVRAANGVVECRLRGQEAGMLRRAGEVIREAWKGPEAVPDSVPQYDPAAVDELKREGIDLAAVVELRGMMRIALTEKDPAVRMKMAVELKRRFGLDPDARILGTLERAGGVPGLSLTERGRRFVRGMVDGVSGMYERLIKEVSL